MKAIRKVVKRDEVKFMDIPKEFGKKIEIIVLPATENSNIITKLQEDKRDMYLAKLQQENGFSKNVLADKNEDVWNEL